jgi:SagB-type dehydrogenase family enzyme
MKNILICIAMLIMAKPLFAQEEIALPNPEKTVGKSLMVCLSERKSAREFSSKEISLQEISNILWAANGINREEEGKHTAPTANNRQNMELYVILPAGAYFYMEKEHKLKLVNPGNHMKSAGRQDFVEKAAMNIVIVSDMSKLADSSDENKLLYAGIHTGAIMQNIYLYCASAELNTVARRYFDEELVSEVLKLSPDKKPVLAQTIGYK